MIDHNPMTSHPRTVRIQQLVVNKPSCCVKIGKFRTRALLDTGAELSVLSLPLYQQIKRSSQVGEIRETPITLVTADGTPLQNAGEVEVTFNITSKTFRRTFVVAPDLGHAMILGWDTIRDEGFLINGQAHTVTVKGTEIELQEDASMASLVRLVEDITLLPQSATFVKARRARNLFHQDGFYVCTPAEDGVLKDEPGLMLANSLNFIQKGRQFGIRLINNTGRTYDLKRGNVIGKLEQVTSEDTLTAGECEPLMPPVTPNMRQVGGISVEEKPSNLRELLTENADMFAENDLELGCTHLTYMTIDTGDHPPISLKPYRAPLMRRQFIEEKVDEMLKSGIISESRSPWSAPVVIVGKKDGSQRFCVDFRQLNNCTARYNFPLPHIDDLISNFSGSKYFTTLDLRSGYHQLPMHPRDAHKTAFVCFKGCYEFNRLPFGLVNAPSVFSALMGKVLDGLPFSAAYLDDIIIWSETEEEHLLHIKEVFQRLRKAGLKLKRSKCEFFKKELTYLGHVITPDGSRPCNDKVEVIQNMSPPSTVKEVRSFIGMCSYYRRYVPDFSKIAKPLTALTKKSAEFNWTVKCQESFQTLKDALSTSPILAFPNLEKKFYVYTDASDIAVGAVLVQEQEDGPHAIHYISSALTPTQGRWPIIEREAWAIIHAVRKFKPYLFGTEFIIRTDHKPLEYLFRSEIKNVKVQKWAMELGQYNCTIEYITGPKNVQADFLSRLPGQGSIPVSVINTDKIRVKDPPPETTIGSQEGTSEDELPCLLGEGVPLNMRVEQEGDRALKKLKGDIHYTQIDGVLYYISEEPVVGLKLVIPKHLRALVLRECHDELGHMGMDKTYDRVRQKYHWKGIYRDVVQHVTKCVPCNSRNLRQQNAPLQEMDEVNMPFQKLAIDTCGPYPTSHKGNRYLLTCIDMYSGWPEFFPVPDKSAQTVARVLLEEIIPRHGCPGTLLSDNGTEFINAVVTGICEKMNVYRIRTSPYHPQANGKIERIHRVWNDMASKQMTDSRSWDDLIPSALLALRTCSHETTKHSPFYLMTGRDPLLPLDTLLKPRTRYMGEEGHEHILERHHKAMIMVHNNHRKAQERAKRYHDRKARDSDLQVGDPVYIFNNNRSSKLDPRWKPYYRVVQRVTPVNFVVRNVVTGALRKVHVVHLRRASVEWEIPERNEGERPRRKAQLAAPHLHVNEDSGTEIMSTDDDQSFNESDDIPLARVRENLSFSEDSDDIPLARVRDRLRGLETRQSQQADRARIASEQSEIFLGDQQVDVSGSNDLQIPQGENNFRQHSSETSEISDIADLVETAEPSKRGRQLDSDDEVSGAKRARLNKLNRIERKKKTKSNTQPSKPKSHTDNKIDKVINLIELVASLA